MLQDAAARSQVAIAVHDPEGDVVAVEPLVVVDGCPVEDAPNVDASVDRLVDDGQAASEVVSPEVVVISPDPVFGHEERRSRKQLVQAIEDHFSSGNGTYPNSEANTVINNFNALSQQNQQDLVNFLRSL